MLAFQEHLVEYTRLACVDVIDEGFHALLVVLLPADNSFKMQAVLLVHFVVYLLTVCDRSIIARNLGNLIVNNPGSLSVFRLSFFLRLAVRLLSYTFSFLHLSFLFSLLTSGLSRWCHLVKLKSQTRPKSTELRMLADILLA